MKNVSSLPERVDITAGTKYNSCAQLPGREKRSSLLGKRMPPNPQEHGFVWHVFWKEFLLQETMSDVIHSSYEKCTSRLYFFLLRRPVKVGGCDEDLHAARRLKWFKNFISQCCVYKMGRPWALSPPFPHTFCWAWLCWKLDCMCFEVVPSDHSLEIFISIAG